jgi:hypothetical protein
MGAAVMGDALLVMGMMEAGVAGSRNTVSRYGIVTCFQRQREATVESGAFSGKARFLVEV